MKNRKLRIVNYLLSLGGVLLTAFCYPSLPEQIPMHWNIDGSVTYNSKGQIFLMCGMAVFFAFMVDVLPKIDPRRKNYRKFDAYYDSFCVIMQIFMLAMNGIILLESFRPGTVSVPMVTMTGVGILFLFIGNILPKIKSNFYMGIKTPWALSSDEVWRKTHRLGGKCFFLAGLFMLISAFLPSRKSVYLGTFLCVMTACILPGIMSYIWWKREQHTESM